MAPEPVRDLGTAAASCPVPRCPLQVAPGELMCPEHMARIPVWERRRLEWTSRPPYGVGTPKHNEATWLAVVAVTDLEA